MQPTKRTKITIAVIIVALAGLITLIWSLGESAGKVSVEIVTVPSDSSLTIDGQPAKTGKVTLSKGKHTLRATRQFFGAVTKEVDTKTLESGKTIYLSLDANTQEALDFMASHPEEGKLADIAGGAEFDELQERLLEEYPIITELPYENLDYKIAYSVDENRQLVFEITLFPVAAEPGSDDYKEQLLELKEAALEYLDQKGVDIDKAPIKFSPNPDQ